jgi:hypothetical protein
MIDELLTIKVARPTFAGDSYLRFTWIGKTRFDLAGCWNDVACKQFESGFRRDLDVWSPTVVTIRASGEEEEHELESVINRYTYRQSYHLKSTALAECVKRNPESSLWTVCHSFVRFVESIYVRNWSLRERVLKQLRDDGVFAAKSVAHFARSQQELAWCLRALEELQPRWDPPQRSTERVNSSNNFA